MAKQSIIKKWFTDQKETTKTQETEVTTIPISMPSYPVSNLNSLLNSSTASIDQKMYDTLMQELETENIPGPDMLEFMKAYKATAGIAADDVSKIKMVLGTLLASGAKIEQITGSADHYFSTLDKAKSKFDQVVVTAQSQDIDAKIKEIENLQKLNEVNNSQIQQLMKEVSDNTIKMQQLKTQIDESKFKLSQKIASFQATLDAVKNEVKSNLTKIQSIGVM